MFTIILCVLLVIIILWSWVPPIIRENVLTPEDVELLRTIAHNRFKPSAILSDTPKKDASVRVSETAWIKKGEHPDVDNIIRKVTGLNDLSNCESIQVVRYGNGMYYKPHYDTCYGAKDACAKDYKRGGLRVRTHIIGLSDGYEGGYTNFPTYGKKYKVPKGGVFTFHTLDRWGFIAHPYALHEGTEVTSGEKMIANVWVRQNKFI